MASLSTVMGPDWDTVFVIGGGHSLAGFDFESLRGETVLAVNDAMIQLPWATCVFSADRVWATNRSNELASFKGERYLATGTLEPSIEGVQYLERSVSCGLSDDLGVIHVRGSSGYGALNLAYLKKARRVFLLGFDYSLPNSHWFPDYKWSGGRDVEQYVRWADAFESTVDQLLMAGTKVINASPGSIITAFPKCALQDLVNFKGEKA